MAREVWITGYGLLSPQGETPDEWWPKLQDPALFRQAIDSESFPPFHIFSIRTYDLSRQVPKPGDQRAMGPLMHYGVYAAGLALEAAGVKGDETLLPRTHLVVAAGGGERDWDLDRQLIAELDKAPDRAAVLNKRLSDDLRPTLFLAQLPNLFAGNISLVHGVSGSSCTFMGEEPAGVDAVRIAFEKIGAGQGDLFLVGSASNASRPDVIYALHVGADISRPRPIFGTGPRRASISAAPARSWCWKRASTPRRAAYRGWRGSRPCSTTARTAGRARRLRRRDASSTASRPG
jgi:3-oxoacyl-[acyl-carrier-protein] synthase II